MTRLTPEPMPWWRWIDIPPVWLALCLAAAWAGRQPSLFPSGSPYAALGQGFDLLAILLVAAGIGLMAWALLTMARARTTPVPHQPPAALVMTGPFRLTRNPIYLGDALVLSGALLWWHAWVMAWLLPLFVWIITVRFIRPEEARLRTAFGPDFEAWAARTRRWL